MDHWTNPLTKKWISESIKESSSAGFMNVRAARNGSNNQWTNQTLTSESVNEPGSRSMNQQIKKWINESINESDWSINESMNWKRDQWISQKIKKLINESINWETHQWINEFLIGKWIKKWFKKWINESINNQQPKCYNQSNQSIQQRKIKYKKVNEIVIHTSGIPLPQAYGAKYLTRTTASNARTNAIKT